jgi:hypothetical protein
MALSKGELVRLAEAGARVRLQELQAEIDSIRRSFPGLRSGGGASARLGAAAMNESRRLRGWTAAQKREVSERMKRYWAAKRAAKKKR